MSISDAIEKASGSILGWVVITVLGGLLWLVRRVFTNQKQIEMLQREIVVRDQRREEDRAAFNEMRQDMKEIRSDVRKLFQHDR